ncbi:MAG: hypothetical protein ACJASQ_002199 [Crocinitomicaceae bacterium]|jgi:hypothetical protein
MKPILIFLLLIVSSALHAQSEMTFVIDDFNNDGYQDTMEYHYDGGSGSGGLGCTLSDGSNDAVFKMNSWGCFCDIRFFILIPPELQKEENASFLKEFEKILLPEKREKPDPSLQWINEADNSKTVVEDSLVKNFDLFFNVDLKWNQGPMESLTRYYLETKGDELDRHYFTQGGKPEWYDKELNQGWLIYSGNLHNRTLFRDQGSTIIKNKIHLDSISSTSVGISIHKNNKYAWVFVSDFEVTGGPEKLRWPSIGKMELVDDHLIVEHNRPPSGVNSLLVINLKNGKVGRLKNDCNGFEIKDGKIIIEEEGEMMEFDLEDIFEELGGF